MDIGLESLLGCSVHDQKLKDVALLLEDKPRRSRRHREFDDAYYISFYRTGVALLVDSRGQITCILICTGPRPQARYHAYPYQLPHGLAADMNRGRVRNTLGTPAESGGPVAMFSGERDVYWDWWIYPDHFMHVEYPTDVKRISIVTLMAPSWS